MRLTAGRAFAVTVGLVVTAAWFIWPAQGWALFFLVVFGLALWVWQPGSQTLQVLGVVFLSGGNVGRLIRNASIVTAVVLGQAALRIWAAETDPLVFLVVFLALCVWACLQGAWVLR